ncbi:13157_t:CDS:2 [Entrophospora sp. SA101]|nr:13157_t:CDS:2 [Entrophospora sp. SA101]
MVTKSKTTKQQYKSLLQGEAKLELDEATKKAFATFIKKAKKHKQFINGVYQEAQQTLSYLFDYPPYLGNLKIYTKVIYLNSLFITEQFNITNNPEYGLPNLANTIAHEIAHCLIADYDPKQAGKHDDSTHEGGPMLESVYRQMKYHFKEHGTMDCLFESVADIEDKAIKSYLTKTYRDYQTSKKQGNIDFFFRSEDES